MKEVTFSPGQGASEEHSREKVLGDDSYISHVLHLTYVVL